MQDIIVELGQCLADPPRLKSQPDYLELRAAKFNAKAGFHITSDQQYSKPSIVLDDSTAPDYNLASSSVFSQFDFTRVMEQPH